MTVTFELSVVAAGQVYRAVRDREAVFEHQTSDEGIMMTQQYRELSETLYTQFKDQTGWKVG